MTCLDSCHAELYFWLFANSMVFTYISILTMVLNISPILAPGAALYGLELMLARKRMEVADARV